jgi:putative transposase
LELEFFAVISRWLGGAKDDEGIQILRRTEGVHSEAGGGRRSRGGHLPQGRDQQATYFNWKKRYDGMLPPDMRRLKQLEDENAKLRKLVADLSLDKEMLQDIIRRKL